MAPRRLLHRLCQRWLCAAVLLLLEPGCSNRENTSRTDRRPAVAKGAKCYATDYRMPK